MPTRGKGPDWVSPVSEPIGAAVSVLGAVVRPGEALCCLPVVKDPKPSPVSEPAASPG